MPVNRDADGNRYVQAEAEVPGTPEEVWAAIASGKGVSSWFVPTNIEEKVDGVVTSNFGPGMESLATVKVWQPPHRFVADSRDDMGPDGPTIATEWIVEARSGGKCVVRVVHRWFTDKDDWDNQFEGHTHGWISFFRILRLYLAHFKGLPCSTVQFTAFTPRPIGEAWGAFVQGLGLSNAKEGERFTTGAGAPRMTGWVERVGPEAHPELLLRLEEPVPGGASLFAMPMGGQVLVIARLYLYGDQAPAAVAKCEPAWQTWINGLFPPPGA